MKYPDMYKQLLRHITALADPEYQRKVWVDGDYPPGVQLDNFDLVIHFLFDDTLLAEKPESAIGWFLENKQQAAAVKKIIDRIDRILDDHVDIDTDEEYIALDEWIGVVEAARDALKLFPPIDPIANESAG